MTKTVHNVTQQELSLMMHALKIAAKSPLSSTAMHVGAVLVHPDNAGTILFEGFSRETDNNHAEAMVFLKAHNANVSVKGMHLYTTMEPCSVRTTGGPACCKACIEEGISRVYIGVQEPSDFVICNGLSQLEDAGIEVVFIPELQEECLRVARGYRESPEITCSVKESSEKSLMLKKFQLMKQVHQPHEPFL